MRARKKAAAESTYSRVAMVLQGGGALGTYQMGVYQALEEANYLPTWFAGTSIGAINAAIMAGNPPEERLAKLDEFWDTISRFEPWPSVPANGAFRRLSNYWGSFQAAVLGQPGFFRPRAVNPWFAPPGAPDATSYYDTGALLETLAEVIDLDRLNAGDTRLSLGAVQVRTGRQVYFDSAREKIGFEHIVASGALPPGFPPVDIGGELYWDGGLLSNTPLDVVLDDEPRVNTLVFMADLFDPVGPAPRTMDDVMERRKDITYASRSHCHIEAYHTMHDLRRAVSALWSRLPAEAQADPEMNRLRMLGCTTTMNVVHLIYRSQSHHNASKDYDFSRASLEEHRAAGYRDARDAIRKKPWARPAPPHVGVVVHEAAPPVP